MLILIVVLSIIVGILTGQAGPPGGAPPAPPVVPPPALDAANPLPETAYRARQLAPKHALLPAPIVIERNVALAKTHLGISDSDPDKDGWAVVGDSGLAKIGDLAALKVIAEVPSVSVNTPGGDCAVYVPVRLDAVKLLQARPLREVARTPGPCQDGGNGDGDGGDGGDNGGGDGDGGDGGDGGGDGGDGGETDPNIVLPNDPEVPDTTKVLAETAIESVSGDLEGDVLVRVPAGAMTGNRGLKVNDILVTGVGPETPYGLLRKIKALTIFADGSAELTTEPALLKQAVPEGRIEVEIPLVAAGTRQISALKADGREVQASTADDEIELPSFSFELGPIECGLSGGTSAKLLDQSIVPSVVFRTEWGADDRLEWRVGLRADVSGIAQFSGELELECSYSLELVKERALGTVVFMVGSVPVVIVPVVDFEFAASISVKGSGNLTIPFSGRLEAGLERTSTGVGPYSATQLGASPTFDGSYEAKVSWKGEPAFGLLFYGVVGLRFQVSMGPEATFLSCRDPLVRIDFAAEAELSLSTAKWLDDVVDGTGGAGVELYTFGPARFLMARVGDPEDTPGMQCDKLFPTTLPIATVDEEYEVPITTLLSLGSVGWEIEPEEPTIEGITFERTDTALRIHGTPTEVGEHTFTVRATNSDGVRHSREYVLEVSDMRIEPPSLPTAELEEEFQVQLSLVPAANAIWTVVDGQLPEWLVLSGNGLLFGTPDESGEYTFTVQAELFNGRKLTRNYSLNVATFSVYPASLPVAKLDKEYHVQLYTEPILDVIWQIEGALPDGLQLNSVDTDAGPAGSITGTPELDGKWTFTIRAIPDDGRTPASRTYTMTIGERQILPPTLPNAPYQFDYSQQLTVDPPPESATITWEVIAGELPPGIELNPTTGLISGTATERGEFAFTVRATPSDGSTPAEREYTVVVEGKIYEGRITYDGPPPTPSVHPNPPNVWAIDEMSFDILIKLVVMEDGSSFATAFGTFRLNRVDARTCPREGSSWTHVVTYTATINGANTDVSFPEVPPPAIVLGTLGTGQMQAFSTGGFADQHGNCVLNPLPPTFNPNDRRFFGFTPEFLGDEVIAYYNATSDDRLLLVH